ncbi:MAG TPA: glycosyltransferase [Flavobacterium sp.]|uniref:glycosyltransferase family 2 protein n=1 Tax=Flavobacterium sp. TaxID=239 RepID=UPI002B73FCFC|nr:glycosyltransferase [Flavobacterium sp.]HNP32558.1 glycosyltransferase [Flavobacterium sp.]
MLELKEFTTKSGEKILYNGNPDFDKLETFSEGVGDIWHSSFEQGYKNAFPELVYQTATFFWFLKDFDNLDVCVSWRVNPNHFAVRKSVWETLNGFDADYKNVQMQALDFGYNALRISGGIPLYVKGLFESDVKEKITISAKDRYAFFIKNFKIDHAVFMIYREGFWKLKEWNAFFYAKKKYKKSDEKAIIKPRELKPIQGNPTVSYIIPTMMRQDYTLNLLNDLSQQNYKPTQVVIVDATPENQRNESLYNPANYPFELIVKWQVSKGSCRARNEAIDLCTGDYIIFGDDDIRLPAEYIQNHISFLQTYNAGACNGLDIRADHQKQNLDDLKYKLNNYGKGRYLSGVAQIYNNANNCVKKEYVDALIGNDINYDGGYGEDIDFGFDLLKIGVIVLQNPFSTNLHLKPPVGGYRFWGNQAKITGKKRKKQPWELDVPVKWIRPIPSPTLMYYYYKQFGKETVNEYRHKYFFLFLFKGSKLLMPIRFLKMPYRQLQFNKSIFYAKKLLKLGRRTK